MKNNPTKYVSSNFANGKFDINGNVYVAGEGVLYTTLDAALAASIFHFNTLSVPNLKKELNNYNIEVRV